MLNAMTIDLEDWAQAVVGPDLPVTEHVLANTERVLRFLDRHRVRATFFALGKVCERFASLLPDIASAGHEIASHGYGHELVYRQTPEQFERDVQRSIEIIEAQIGRRPTGYRAPAFSITRQSTWAGPVLERLGFRYSSSIFPVRKQRYGMPDSPRFPHRWAGSELIEFPLTTLRMGGRNWPACGGGYTRLLPAAVMAHAIRRMNRDGHPAVIYLHPYELASGEVSDFVRAGTRVSSLRRLTQELWRSRVEPRLARLLGEFRFGSMSTALACHRLGRQFECVQTDLYAENA
jgi:polysaccharide deacetylase family protein (PEP-CTERM system associated)